MITDRTLDGILLIMWLSLPAIVAATVVGLLVGLFQALTQIQDQTLPYGIKLVVVTISLVATGYVMGGVLIRFTVDAFDSIAKLP